MSVMCQWDLPKCSNASSHKYLPTGMLICRYHAEYCFAVQRVSPNELVEIYLDTKMIDVFDNLYRTLVKGFADKHPEMARAIIERVRIASDELTGIVNTTRAQEKIE